MSVFPQVPVTCFESTQTNVGQGNCLPLALIQQLEQLVQRKNQESTKLAAKLLSDMFRGNMSSKNTAHLVAASLNLRAYVCTEVQQNRVPKFTVWQDGGTTCDHAMESVFALAKRPTQAFAAMNLQDYWKAISKDGVCLGLDFLDALASKFSWLPIMTYAPSDVTGNYSVIQTNNCYPHGDLSKALHILMTPSAVGGMNDAGHYEGLVLQSNVSYWQILPNPKPTLNKDGREMGLLSKDKLATRLSQRKEALGRLKTTMLQRVSALHAEFQQITMNFAKQREDIERQVRTIDAQVKMLHDVEANMMHNSQGLAAPAAPRKKRGLPAAWNLDEQNSRRTLEFNNGMQKADLFPEKTRFEEELLSLQDDDKSAADDAAQSLLPICVSDHQLAPSTPFGVSDAGQNKMGGLPWFDPSDVPFSSEQLVEDQEDLD